MRDGKKRILKDGTAVYDISYYDAANKRHWKTCYSAAERRLFKAEKVREKRQGVVVNDVRFVDFAERLLGFSALSQRERTVIHSRSVFENHLKPRFGDAWMSRITREMIEDFLLELQKKIDPKTKNPKYKPGYLKDILKRLNVILNAAVDRRIIPANPAARLSKLFRPITDAPLLEKSFNEDDLLTFLLHCKSVHSHCYMLFLLMARSGLRSGEALALGWEFIDTDKRLIDVQRAIGPKGDIQTTKTNEHRFVDMSEQLREALVRLRNEQVKKAFASDTQPPAFLFPDTTQRHTGHHFKRVLRKANLPSHFTPTSLRHTFARLLLEKGVRVEEVQRRMGHNDINVTNGIYGKWANLSGQGAVNNLDQKELDTELGVLVNMVERR